MNLELKDFLHLYLGCECIAVVDGNKWSERLILTGVSYDDQHKTHWAYFENTELGYCPYSELKPILRPLSSMTEEEWIKCFELARGVYDQSMPGGKRMATTEMLFTLGKMQYIFGCHGCFDNDVRIGWGLCFYLKTYLIEENVSVGESGIEVSESWFNKMEKQDVHNINHIINYLRKQGIDCDGLIEAGLAIDKTSLTVE